MLCRCPCRRRFTLMANACPRATQTSTSRTPQYWFRPSTTPATSLPWGRLESSFRIVPWWESTPSIWFWVWVPCTASPNSSRHFDGRGQQVAAFTRICVICAICGCIRAAKSTPTSISPTPMLVSRYPLRYDGLPAENGKGPPIARLLPAFRPGFEVIAMRILVTGSNGLIGHALLADLSANGHNVVTLTRSKTHATGRHILWDPDAGVIDKDDLEDFEAVIHLAGESILGRWTPQKKARILESRAKGTR